MRGTPLALAALALGTLACHDVTEPTSTPPALASRTTAAGGQTVLNPGDDIQARVNAAPAGTAFILKAGVYRLQSIRPKDGMSFTGEPGAILSGARLLTSFSRQGSYWVATGQTQQGNRSDDNGSHSRARCTPEFPRCHYPEQLFINDVQLRHVASLSQVRPGTWYFDYAADKIYLGDNPEGKKVEAAATPQAFSNRAAHVTIRNLIIEKYATPLQGAAVHAGTAWLLENNEVRYNNAVGIKTASRTVARRNYVHHNGQLGMGGSGDGALIEDNEIAYNEYRRTLEYGWSTGGTKFYVTRNLVLRRNFVHHNKGPGIWTDIDNIHTVIEYNRVEDNARNGIFHEISYDAVIRYNTASRNGAEMPARLRGGGIAVTSSANVEIYGNTLVHNQSGFAINQDNRGSGRYGLYEVRNLNVHDNVVTMGGGSTGLGARSEAYYTSKRNRFTRNTYRLGSSTKPFWWKGRALTADEWKRQGQDVTGTFSR